METLTLSGHTKVTSTGLVHLKELTNRQRLGLSASNVTDFELVHLKGLTKLGTLFLLRTRVTDEGVKNLKQALPKCRIVRRIGQTSSQ